MPVLLAAVATNPAVSHALLAACVMLAIIPPALLAVVAPALSDERPHRVSGALSARSHLGRSAAR